MSAGNPKLDSTAPGDNFLKIYEATELAATSFLKSNKHKMVFRLERGHWFFVNEENDTAKELSQLISNSSDYSLGAVLKPLVQKAVKNMDYKLEERQEGKDKIITLTPGF